MSIQSLCAQDFETMNRISSCASNGSKASGFGTEPPEAGEYLSNKYEIRISPKISVIPSGAFPQPLN